MKTLKTVFLVILMGWCLWQAEEVVAGAPPEKRSGDASLDAYNVGWDSPSANALGSMPLGNGDVGINAWVEPSGDLLFYIGKTDAWDENHRLCKVGRVRVKFDPALGTSPHFRQELKLREGMIYISGTVNGKAVVIRLWVDADEPVVRLEADAELPLKCRAEVELWRLKERPFTKDTDSASGMALDKGRSKPVILTDTVVQEGNDRVVWYHRNLRSTFGLSLEQQRLQSLQGEFNDPLLNHTFGASLRGDGMKRVGERAVESERSSPHHLVSITVLASQTPTAEAWLGDLSSLERRAGAKKPEASRAATTKWWTGFWERSWVFVGDPSSAGMAEMTRGYVLQRFMSACSGRGASPIKFNGSIFAVEPTPGMPEDADGGDGGSKAPNWNTCGCPDARRWGGHYWFQNTRLCYWPMLASGDFEMMDPWFRYFKRALPLVQRRTQSVYGFEATAQFPEITMLWGLSQFMAYGWGNTQPEDALKFTKRYFNGNVELIALMLDRYDFTRDETFARETLVPLATPLLSFYDQYWKERDASGKIRFAPSQALETFWDTVNPMPEIAGLRFVLPRMLSLPETLTTPEQRARWQKLLNDLPPVPVREVHGNDELRKYWMPYLKDERAFPREPRSKLNGDRILVAAAEINCSATNKENPELYCIFPYRLFGAGKPDLELARRTYDARVQRQNFGWCQDSIQAALLGLGDDAGRQVARRAPVRSKTHRFPAMWGPNADWTPDQDHGSNLMTSLQYMLLQTDEGKIRVLPAWPKNWDVNFRLHGANKTVVECVYRAGKIETLRVSPEERRKDVVLPEFK